MVSRRTSSTGLLDIGIAALFVLCAAALPAQTRPPTDAQATGTGAVAVSGTAAPPGAAATTDEILVWLTLNSAHPSFDAQLQRALETVTRLDQVRTIGDSIIPLIVDQDLLRATANRLARIAMIGRDYEIAADLFETAYIASGGTDLAALFAQAQMLLQLGRLSQAEQRARTVVAQATGDFELRRRGYALVGRAMHQSGRNAEAARVLETLSALDETQLVEPDTLLLQSSVRQALGQDASASIAHLQRLHPDSVAARLARGDRIIAAPLPATLFASPIDAGPLEPEPRPVAAPQPTAIQVGSFGDSDNALHLVDDLLEIGLDAYTEPTDRDGNRLHLVLVRTGADMSASRAVAVLRDAGYDGFLVY